MIRGAIRPGPVVSWPSEDQWEDITTPLFALETARG